MTKALEALALGAVLAVIVVFATDGMPTECPADGQPNAGLNMSKQIAAKATAAKQAFQSDISGGSAAVAAAAVGRQRDGRRSLVDAADRCRHDRRRHGPALALMITPPPPTA